MPSRSLALAAVVVSCAASARAGGSRFQRVDTGGVALRLTSLAERPDGGLVIAGIAANGDSLVGSLAPDGHPEWVTRLSTGDPCRPPPAEAAALSSGEVVVTGSGSLIAVLDQMGSLVRSIDARSGYLQRIAVNGDMAMAVGVRGQGAWFVKLGATGVIEETVDESEFHCTLASAVTAIPGGGWWAGGQKWSMLEPRGAALTWRLDPDGRLLGANGNTCDESVACVSPGGGVVQGQYCATDWITIGPSGHVMRGLSLRDFCGNLYSQVAVDFAGQADEGALHGTPTDGPAYRLPDGRGIFAQGRDGVMLRGAHDEPLWTLRAGTAPGPALATRVGAGVIQSFEDGASFILARIDDECAVDAAGCTRPERRPASPLSWSSPAWSGDSGGGTTRTVDSAWAPAALTATPECPGAACWTACAVEDCMQPDDEDGDGLADCDDDDCALASPCDVTDSDGDGVPDVLDEAPYETACGMAPDGEPLLTVARMSWGGAVLDWSPVARTTEYAVAVLHPLNDRPAVIDYATDTTYVDDTGLTDAWYVVRATNPCGTGPSGTSLLD